MRISTSQFHDGSFGSIAKHQQDLLKIQEQLSTGKRINHPSDDPVGMSQVIGLKKTMAQITQFEKNGNYAKSQLSLEETEINSTVDVVQRARELTIQMMNGTYSPENRKAVSSEIGQLAEHLKNLMNSKNPEKQLLFAGNNINESAAFVTDANHPDYTAYIGSSNAGAAQKSQAVYGSRFVQISFDSNNTTPSNDQGDPSRVRITDVGATTFTPSSNSLPPGIFDIPNITTQFKNGNKNGPNLTPQPDPNIYNLVKELQKYLANGDAPPASIGQDFDKAINNLSKHLAEIGGRQNRVQSQYDAGQSFTMALDERRMNIEETDVVAATSKFTQTQTALQMAQQVFTKVNQLSLFNYLR